MTSTMIDLHFEVEVFSMTMQDGTPYVTHVECQTLVPLQVRQWLEGLAVADWCRQQKEGKLCQVK
jgi:hypothetical protein